MNNCSCIYVGEYDGPEFYDRKIVKARKVHKCCECGREIVFAEEYENICGKWDGVFSLYKTCLDCVAIREAMFCEGWYFETMIDDLIEHIRYAGGGISEDCLAGLPPRARGLVCDLIEDYWEDME